MNRKSSSLDLFGLFPIFMIFVVAFMFVGIPLTGVGRVIATQQALNQECNTNYSFLQVAFAGDNLARLCQIKNQTVTIK